jgi:hypothetical protein
MTFSKYRRPVLLRRILHRYSLADIEKANLEEDARPEGRKRSPQLHPVSDFVDKV